MKRILPLFLALSLLLCACAAQPEETEPSTMPTTAPTEATVPVPPTTEPVTEPATEPETEPTEPPELLYQHPLTGEALAEPFVNRLFAVSTNNVSPALPHIGTSQADILYELLVDAGGSTRCVAIYSDVSQVPKLGSIRSARTYLVNVAYAYNAIFIHVGGSSFGNDRIKELGMAHLDHDAKSPFYRDQARLSAGYALEHTMVVSGEDAAAYAKEKGYDLTVAPDTTYGLHFVEDATPSNGESAEEITITFLPGSKKTTMTYNAEDGLYYGTQYGKDFKDENNGQLLSFKNVFILHADTRIGPDGVHRFTNLSGEGKGYYATGGKLIPIKWHHEKDADPFTFTLEDGTPLEQSVGTSYIAVIGLSGSIKMG